MTGIDLSSLNDAQRRIATTLDAPLFVEAGAGSGKTFTLTRRIAWALSPGSGKDGRPFLDGLDQVLVITFTNAAAREIKERVRSSLHAAGMRDAALAVDSAWISTIHGMCRRILQRSALDLGLDPDFDICSNHVAEELLEQAVEEVVGGARRSAGAGSPLARAFEELEYGGVVMRVRGLVQQAHAAPGGFASLDVVRAGDVASVMSALLNAFEALGAAKLSPAARAKVGPSLDVLRAFDALPPGEQTLAAAREAVAACALPSRSKAIAELHAEVKAELAYAEAFVQLASVGTLAPELLALAHATDERYGRLKRERSVLDNDDLVSMALEAVSGNRVVAARYAGRFRLVMVDEFQDTDAKQLRLISILAGADPGQTPGPGTVAAEPRHLATVGDAQQSIYRFRGADVSVFNARGRRIDAVGHVRLDINYRSHEDVLSMVDAVCGGADGVLEGFMHLDANPRRKDGYHARALPRIAVEVASGPASAGYPSKAQVTMLAAQVADRLVRYREAGEPAGGMALLLGSTTNADVYIDALRSRGLECVVTGGSTFTRAPEVHVMLALLRTLASPADTQSGLFPVLSSGMFELDANDFLQLGTRAQERLDAPTKRSIERGLATLDLFGGAVPSQRVRRAHEVLSRAWADLATKPVADVCLDVLCGSGWLARLEAQGPAGRAQEANLLAAVRYIRDLTDELGLGPVRAAEEFERWLDTSKVPPASLAGEESDTVRIMTIHASKGLEYPVVAVAECWNNPRQDAGLLATRRPDGTTQVVLVPKGGVKTNGLDANELPDDIVGRYLSLKEQNTADDDQEKARLLYVALTRAREALVLGLNVACSKSGISSRLAAGTVGALFGGELPPAGECRLPFGGSEPALVRHVDMASGEGAASVAMPQMAAVEEGAGRSVALYPAEPRLCDEVQLDRARPDVFSYSSALAGHAAPTAEPSGTPPAQTLPTRQQREAEAAGEPSPADADKATSLGSAFHLLAQAMVESGQEPSQAQVEAMSRRWGLSARQRTRLAAALELWEASELRREALSYGLVRPEVPFFMDAGASSYGRYVEGAIDLLCTDGPACAGHALVVDYKTGDLGLSEQAMRARHDAQAKLYAQVLLRAGFSSVTCAFIAVETGQVVRWDL